jgi:hypothetical protein
MSRSQWPRGLRNEPSSPSRTLGSWFRIPHEAWMSVCVYSVCVVLCVGSGLATGWSPVQGVLPGRAIAQAVSRWLPTAMARVRARVWLSVICGGLSGVGTGFLRVLRFPLQSSFHQILHHHNHPGQVQLAIQSPTCRVTQLGLQSSLWELKKN